MEQRCSPWRSGVSTTCRKRREKIRPFCVENHLEKEGFSSMQEEEEEKEEDIGKYNWEHKRSVEGNELGTHIYNGKEGASLVKNGSIYYI